LLKCTTGFCESENIALAGLGTLREVSWLVPKITDRQKGAFSTTGLLFGKAWIGSTAVGYGTSWFGIYCNFLSQGAALSGSLLRGSR